MNGSNRRAVGPSGHRAIEPSSHRAILGDCGLQIADCGLVRGEAPANPQSEIHNPKSSSLSILDPNPERGAWRLAVPFSFFLFPFTFLLLGCAAASAQADGKDTVERVRTQPILWPGDHTITALGKEVLKEERRLFADELRHLKEWIPDNMRGAVSKTWTRSGKTMISESHAIEHVPEMPAEQVERIIAELEDGARNTVFDNLQRFQAAVAKRVPVFAKALEEFKAGQYVKATETVSVLTKENVLHVFQLYQYDTMPPYVYCTVTLFEGECFSLDGALHEAAVRYLICSKGKLPLSLTFSTTTRLRVAEMYEKSERTHFAIPLYQSLAEKFAEVLSDTEILRLHVRARRMMSENPFRRIVAATHDVRRLMGQGRAGPAVQGPQAAMLKLMYGIINADEADGRGNLQINWEMMAGEEQFGRAGLQEGAAPTKLNFETTAQMAGSDDWGKLRPREKQEVIQRFLATYSDEYKDMLEAYFRNMSRAQSKTAQEP